jgi:hypothetical protein
MPQHRMNREEFFARLAPLDEEQLKKGLWNLYWRGAAPVRECVEAEISPLPAAHRTANKAALPDPAKVLDEVRSFTELARSGAYIAGDRRVSPKERSGWRFTFGRLADDARRALAAQDSDLAEQAVAALADLCCSAEHRSASSSAAGPASMQTSTVAPAAPQTCPLGTTCSSTASPTMTWETASTGSSSIPRSAAPNCFCSARRARQTGEMDQARALAAEALETLPGHHELLAFAAEINAELPERAKRVIASR